MEIGGKTQVFAILGDPVAHSLSPLMHNAAFHALGLDAVYIPLRCDAESLGPLMETLARQGGGGNVTLPHKTRAALVINRQATAPATATVTATATNPICNTFWGRDGRLDGAETDSTAILSALSRMGPTGSDWLLLGTGGSARAALEAAKQSGARIAVRSRSAERTAEFERLALNEGLELTQAGACQVVINCTPRGLSLEDPLPLEPAQAPNARVALDLVYRRGETAWVHAMRAAGVRAADGREVLLEQGAAAFELWFPDRVAPREVMRAAVRSALG
ncbi:MAG TPA: hypothetical protein VGQ73_02030 [Gemmatimonadales bacterium]|jgi:shikimate dehydrogenase|nr:hypothetical protein [Gemmatimonadales bacterium]